MKILPPVSRPWSSLGGRRHTPPARRGKLGYRKYRACLRWEFGFSCAFCIGHEADMAAYEAEGLALTQAEHFIPKSMDEQARNDYRNCFYICRRCNVARGTKPNRDARGRILLDPLSRSWQNTFTVVRDRFRPRRGGDADAEYTIETYDLNAPAKVWFRRMRRTLVGARIRFLHRSRGIEEQLLDALQAGGSARLAKIAKLVAQARRQARQELVCFAAIPRDAGSLCLCKTTIFHTLPRGFNRQTLELSTLW